jgi:hypothetical protein
MTVKEEKDRYENIKNKWVLLLDTKLKRAKFKEERKRK